MTPADYRARYEAGESLETLRLDAGVSKADIRELLVHAGATIRPGVGSSGLHRQFHTPTAEAEAQPPMPTARIARPSLARRFR